MSEKQKFYITRPSIIRDNLHIATPTAPPHRYVHARFKRLSDMT
jgi:hypothetical protein